MFCCKDEFLQVLMCIGDIFGIIEEVKVVLSIAGSDPSGGAGVQMDLKVFQKLGVWGMAVVTSLTAQGTDGIKEKLDLPPEFVELQIKSIDIKPDAVKIGMLGNLKIAEAVAESIQNFKNIVLDPIFESKTGFKMIDNPDLFKVMIPFTSLLTPNVVEAEVICGIEISNIDGMKLCAERIVEMGAGACFIKGGHLRTDEVVDVLFDGFKFYEFRTPWLKVVAHGTGCTLSSAIAAFLARDYRLEDAVGMAKAFVFTALKRACKLGKGFEVLLLDSSKDYHTISSSESE